MAKHSEIIEQLEILRRISERGLSFALLKDWRFVDLFQHLLDEIDRARLWEEDLDLD